MTEFGEFPVVRIELERMKMTLCQAISKHALVMDEAVKRAVDKFCTVGNIERMFEQQVDKVLAGVIEEEVQRFYRYGKGRAAVRRAIEAKLEESDE